MKALFATLLIFGAATTAGAAECHCLQRNDKTPLIDTICLDRDGRVDLYQQGAVVHSFTVNVTYVAPHRACTHGHDGPICSMTPPAYSYDNRPLTGAPWPLAVLDHAFVPVEKDPPGEHRGYMNDLVYPTSGPDFGTYRFWPSESRIVTPEICAGEVRR